MPPPPLGLEILTLSLSFESFKAYFCLFYRPPSSTISIFDTLYSYLESIDICQLRNFVLLGDFNVDYDSPSHYMYSKLHIITTLYCVTQVVSGPTHVHHDDSKSTIDLVFCLISHYYTIVKPSIPCPILTTMGS